jgi:hypothetical protein
VLDAHLFESGGEGSLCCNAWMSGERYTVEWGGSPSPSHSPSVAGGAGELAAEVSGAMGTVHACGGEPRGAVRMHYRVSAKPV